MKSTARSSRLVRSAARSPALAMTGPEVERKLTPSSRAMICASVVLPRPGGPTNRTGSSASPRFFAASMKIFRLARAAACPTKSSSVCGRSETSRSSPRFSGVINRGARLMSASLAEETQPVSSQASSLNGRCSPRQLLEAKADEFGRVGVLASDLNRGGYRIRGNVARVAEIGERGDGIRDRGRGDALAEFLLEPDRAGCLAGKGRGLALQLGDDALGDLLADAGS